MKKLLVLMLVLASSVSFGTMILPQQAGTGLTAVTIDPGQSVTIDLKWLYDGAGVGNLTGADILLTASSPVSWNFDGMTENAQFLPAFGVFNGISQSGDGWIVSGTTWATGVAPNGIAFGNIVVGNITANTVITAKFVADIQGTSVVDSVEPLDEVNGGTGYAGSMNVTVTPEPATLAILGLGGLLLRRKK